jgi:hypothetical protein
MATNNSTNTSFPVSVSQGGTGISFTSPYSPICGGITSTDALQMIDISTSSVGDALTSNGTGALPSWQAVPAAGSLVLLQTLTAPSSGIFVFDSSHITSAYDSYLLIFNNIINQSTSTTYLTMQFSTNNGSTYVVTNYASACLNNTYNSTTLANLNSTSTCPLSISTTGSTNERINGYLYMNFPASNSSSYTGRSLSINASGSVLSNNVLYGGNSGIVTINNIKIYFSVGNIGSGIVSLYGITQ